MNVKGENIILYTPGVPKNYSCRWPFLSPCHLIQLSIHYNSTHFLITPSLMVVAVNFLGKIGVVKDLVVCGDVAPNGGWWISEVGEDKIAGMEGLGDWLQKGPTDWPSDWAG